MYLLDTAPLVSFGALRERGEEAGEVHPGCVAEYGGAFGVVLVQEGAEERVEIVGRGGEVEPGWVEGGGDLGVEFWHSGDGGGVGDEGAAEDADGGGGHGYFDRIVNVCEKRQIVGESSRGCGLPETISHPSGSAK